MRRRGLAIGIAFSGVGIGSIVLLPWLQIVIARDGWRWACLALALITAVVLIPLNLLLRKRPQDIGLHPDGDAAPPETTARGHAGNIVDPAWASIDWTLARAMRTARFWWIALGYFALLYAWYAVQVHQTKYLIEIGVSPMEAAWALGLVSLVGVPGQIIFGHLSDRIGREWAWAIGCLGFVICFAALIALQAGANPVLLYTMVLAQGFLGYSATAVLGPIVAEIFEGPHFGSIFGTVMLGAVDRRRRRPVGHRPAARPHRQLHRGVLDRARAQHRVGRRDLHRGAAQGAARGGTSAASAGERAKFDATSLQARARTAR